MIHRLHFYTDEFEVCNPIGSKRGKHKVLGVYYLVGNMANKYWSEMKFISLCMLLMEYDPNYEKLFCPLIEELKLLASRGVDSRGRSRWHKTPFSCSLGNGFSR